MTAARFACRVQDALRPNAGANAGRNYVVILNVAVCGLPPAGVSVIK